MNAAVSEVADRDYDGVDEWGHDAGSDQFQDNCAAVSTPAPRIVLRLRAPPSCPDVFAESLDEGGARTRQTIDRYLSFEPSQENGAAVSIPVPRIVLRLRAPSSCPDLFAESLDEGGARRRETIDRYSSCDPSGENQCITCGRSPSGACRCYASLSRCEDCLPQAPNYIAKDS
jgi:hypothetical protein